MLQTLPAPETLFGAANRLKEPVSDTSVDDTCGPV